MGLSRSLNNIRHKVGGYKQHAAARAKHNITRQAYRPAEIGYIVPVLHNKFAYGRGVNAPVINLNVRHLFHLLNIPYAAPYYRAACFGAVVQCGSKIAAQKRALVYFIIHIANYNIALI